MTFEGYRHQLNPGDPSFDDPGSVRVLESDEESRREEVRERPVRRRALGLDRPIEDDGARLEETPEQMRAKARKLALRAAREAIKQVDRSLGWLSVDRPDIADQYQKLRDDVERYSEHIEEIAGPDADDGR